MVNVGDAERPGGPAEGDLQKFVAEVRVRSRRAILRVFRLPLQGPNEGDDAVRHLSRLVDPGSHNTNPAATLRSGAIDLAEPGCRTGQWRPRMTEG
jgi:hypothetical protein